ncbi:DUF2161 domain-containing phosphodiesterase [Ferviditalea candida]|uniref:DUF2161 family putative PD-(D/E)XK-type phosphodiesterase n=1 Tax=Ferviditalea candida TaxID=3108399 RepID=A0ABU5ZIX7_9BACL|nr:DUF2161 family putative PD-(D/E)XK-type phosphodiesterase [Paenibacillaceae bacterium T2]
MSILNETELYGPIKRFLENKGYLVKAEVEGCDLVAFREDDPSPVIVEMKKSFNLSLVLQGIDRLKLSDRVYLAVEYREGRGLSKRKWNGWVNLCRMLGLGLIGVKFYRKGNPGVHVLCDPGPYMPNSVKSRTTKLLAEFHGRSGDFNIGGSTQRKIVTVYREQALFLAFMLEKREAASPKELRSLSGIEKAPQILRDNHYEWFERVKRGVYRLSPSGKEALNLYADVLAARFPGESQMQFEAASARAFENQSAGEA